MVFFFYVGLYWMGVECGVVFGGGFDLGVLGGILYIVYWYWCLNG